jgi:perosamine synthetase
MKIPVYKPFLPPNVRRYVNECIDSSWISSRGNFVNKFEDKFCDFLKVPYATSVSNGTVALHLAMLALDIKKGDEVIVPDFTYIASVNSIAYVGAKPILVDADIKTWNINTSLIEERITDKTKAIMAVHLYGNPCDMEKIKKLCDKYNLFLIEDAAEAFGSKYKDSYCGSFGDISTFSFFGNKTITTGEGGMVVSSNSDLHEKIKLLKNQSVSQLKEYWHEQIGFNYRMTNIQSAIGVAQIEKAQEILDKKSELANNYMRSLESLPITFQVTEKNGVNSFWMVSIMVKNNTIRNNLRKHLFENGVETRLFFYPVSEMPVFSTSSNNTSAAHISKTGISLPSFPELSSEEFETIIKLIHNFYQ